MSSIIKNINIKKVLILVFTLVFLFTEINSWALGGIMDKLAPPLRFTDEGFAASFNTFAICKFIEEAGRLDETSGIQDVLLGINPNYTQHKLPETPRKIIKDPLPELCNILSGYNDAGILSAHGKNILGRLRSNDTGTIDTDLGFELKALRGLTYSQAVEVMTIPEKYKGGLSLEEKRLFLTPDEYAEIDKIFYVHLYMREGRYRLMRGCGNHCTFCVAGGYRPVQSLPYPIAIQCLINEYEKYYGNPKNPSLIKLTTYEGDEDALHYRDATAEANICDILRISKDFLAIVGKTFWTAGYSPFVPRSEYVSDALIEMRNSLGESKQYVRVTYHLYRAEIRRAILQKNKTKLIEAVKAYTDMYKDLLLSHPDLHVSNRYTSAFKKDPSYPYSTVFIDSLQNQILQKLLENDSIEKNIGKIEDLPVNWDQADPKMRFEQKEEKDPAIVEFLRSLDINEIVEAATLPEFIPNTMVFSDEIIIKVPEEHLVIRYFDPTKRDTSGHPAEHPKEINEKRISERLVRQIIHDSDYFERNESPSIPEVETAGSGGDPYDEEVLKIKAAHEQNLKNRPQIEKKTILVHVISTEILPDFQKASGILTRLAKDTDSIDCNEKIIPLSVDDPEDTDEFIRRLQIKVSNLKDEYQRKYHDYSLNIVFDVACHNKDIVKRLLEEGTSPGRNSIKALAFKSEENSLISRLEGIILALRVLGTGNTTKLKRAYTLITGKEIDPDIINLPLDQLALKLTFVLPAVKVEIDRISEINKLIEKNIKSAV